MRRLVKDASGEEVGDGDAYCRIDGEAPGVGRVAEVFEAGDAIDGFPTLGRFAVGEVVDVGVLLHEDAFSGHVQFAAVSGASQHSFQAGVLEVSSWFSAGNRLHLILVELLAGFVVVARFAAVAVQSVTDLYCG